MNNTTSTLNTRYISTSGTFLIDCKDDIINVDTSVGATVLVLPNIVQNGLNSIPKSFFINDIGNSAGTNNITILPTPSDSVNSATSFVIATNGGTVICTPSSANEWFCNSAVPSGLITAFNSSWVDYSAISTIVGWASLPMPPTKKILYKIIDNNKTMLVYFSITGTSNSAITTFTIPFATLSGTSDKQLIYCEDLSTATVGVAIFTSASATISFSSTIGGTGFGIIGTKTIKGTLVIPI